MAEDKVQILVIGLGALGTIYSHLLVSMCTGLVSVSPES